jgi:protein-tyrosine-phosphatase
MPDSFLRERDTIVRLGPRAGTIYARLRLLDSLGVRGQKVGAIKPSARHFLFVCFGNIMRSPMAEHMLRASAAAANLNDVRVCSAGLHAINGREAHPDALTASAEIGLPLTEHRAQMLTPEMVSWADIIFVMDFENKAEMLALYPEVRDKLVMFGDYAEGPQRYREIRDPYFGDLETTRRCYVVLRTCVHNFVSDLSDRAATGKPVPAEP